MKSFHALLFLVTASGAQACSCAMPATPKAAFAETETLVEVEFVRDLDEAGDRSTKTRFSDSFVGLARVVRSWKGSPPSVVRVRMGGPSTCSVLLDPGKRYVLELRSGAASVSVCSPFLTAPEKVAADFGPGTMVPEQAVDSQAGTTAAPTRVAPQGASDQTPGIRVQDAPSFDSVEGTP